MTPVAVSFPHQSTLAPGQPDPAATSAMAKSKAKARSSGKRKQKGESDDDALSSNEYFVGMSLDTPRSDASKTQRVVRENPQSKGSGHPEGRGPLGERVFSIVLRVSRGLTLLRPQNYFVKVRRFAWLSLKLFAQPPGLVEGLR